MNILICDDEQLICDAISKFIADNYNHSTFTATNKESAMQKMESNSIALLIIDIVISDINGIDLAKEIHSQYPDIKIIFITGYGDVYYKEIFNSLSPQGFIEKPIRFNTLDFFIKEIEKGLKSKTEKLEQKLKISYNHQDYLIPVDDITHIQSKKRVCEIATDIQIYKYYIKLNDLEKMLPDSFIRCHQSYIVNPTYIKSFQSNQFTLINDEIVPISENHMKEARKAFLLNC